MSEIATNNLQRITIKLRLRDKHAAELNRQARAVNIVWNYCNEAQKHVLRWDRWLSNYDLHGLTAGSNKELDLHSHTIKRVCDEYVISRRRRKKPYLRWRGRKSLGWVPFNTGHVTFNGDVFKFRSEIYEAMHLREILKPGIKIGAGSFNQDNLGHWYINLPIEIECASYAPISHVGIDLGLKSLATLSDGREIEIPQFFRKSESTLAATQRAKKTPKRIRKIHAKVANRRKDFLHKKSNEIVNKYGLIVIGDVSPSNLAKTNRAKSIFDASWSNFKRMLSYKAITRGGMCLEVSEAFTSQVCSECGSLPASRPKGIAGLGIREWTCSDCGVVHGRDVNAARNILRLGLETLAGGAHV